MIVWNCGTAVVLVTCIQACHIIQILFIFGLEHSIGLDFTIVLINWVMIAVLRTSNSTRGNMLSTSRHQASNNSTRHINSNIGRPINPSNNRLINYSRDSNSNQQNIQSWTREKVCLDFILVLQKYACSLFYICLYVCNILMEVHHIIMYMCKINVTYRCSTQRITILTFIKNVLHCLNR
jgi:hypothetical protein